MARGLGLLALGAMVCLAARAQAPSGGPPLEALQLPPLRNLTLILQAPPLAQPLETLQLPAPRDLTLTLQPAPLAKPIEALKLPPLRALTLSLQPSALRPAPPPPPPQAGASRLRILLVDDDISDNNHNPKDTRLSHSDRVFRKLVADAVGGDAGAWAIEIVGPYASGPDFERLSRFSLIVWYTGGNYGGNPDNTSVLGIEDEKSVRRYLEQTGGAVILVSPGYASKVLGADSTWEKSSWPFLSEVMGIRGGNGLAQRFLPGTVSAPDGAKFDVGKGGAVESQFSLVNPKGASVVFSTLPTAAKRPGVPMPVATAFAYGRGRMVYVGFTFENLADRDLAPAFRHLLAATQKVK